MKQRIHWRIQWCVNKGVCNADQECMNSYGFVSFYISSPKNVGRCISAKNKKPVFPSEIPPGGETVFSLKKADDIPAFATLVWLPEKTFALSGSAALLQREREEVGIGWFVWVFANIEYHITTESDVQFYNFL